MINWGKKMILTAYEIWKAIQETHPQKLESKFGFTSQTKFILLDASCEIVESLHDRIHELENK